LPFAQDLQLTKSKQTYLYEKGSINTLFGTMLHILSLHRNCLMKIYLNLFLKRWHGKRAGIHTTELFAEAGFAQESHM